MKSPFILVFVLCLVLTFINGSRLGVKKGIDIQSFIQNKLKQDNSTENAQTNQPDSSITETSILSHKVVIPRLQDFSDVCDAGYSATSITLNTTGTLVSKDCEKCPDLCAMCDTGRCLRCQQGAYLMLLGNETKCMQNCSDSCYTPQFGFCMPVTTDADCLEKIDPVFKQLAGTEDASILKANLANSKDEVILKSLVMRVESARDYIQQLLAITDNEKEKPQTNLTSTEQVDYSSSSLAVNGMATSFIQEDSGNTTNGCSQCPTECKAYRKAINKIYEDDNYQNLEKLRKEACYWKATVGKLFKQFKIITSVSRSIQLVGHLLFSVRQVHEVIKPLLAPMDTITRKFTYRMKMLRQLEKKFELGELCSNLKDFKQELNTAASFHKLVKNQQNISTIESQCSINVCKTMSDIASSLGNVSLTAITWALPTLPQLPFAGTRNATVVLNSLVNILQPLHQMLLNNYTACKPEGCRSLSGLQILIAKSQGDTDKLYEFVLRRINAYSLFVTRPVTQVSGLLTNDQITIPSDTWALPADFVAPAVTYENLSGITNCLNLFTTTDNLLVSVTS